MSSVDVTNALQFSTARSDYVKTITARSDYVKPTRPVVTMQNPQGPAHAGHAEAAPQGVSCGGGPLGGIMAGTSRYRPVCYGVRDFFIMSRTASLCDARACAVGRLHKPIPYSQS